MAVKIKNEIYNLDVVEGENCKVCEKRDSHIADLIIKILDELQMETLFVTRNKRTHELVVMTSGDNMCTEFGCWCK